MPTNGAYIGKVTIGYPSNGANGGDKIEAVPTYGASDGMKKPDAMKSGVERQVFCRHMAVNVGMKKPDAPD